MTHRGPFQPVPFCDSVILFAMKLWKTQEVCASRVPHIERTLRHVLAVSPPRQGRTNQIC